ncbi:type II toxin-antitoxin system RelE/ParE family toxin [Tumidithrix helvetica PCC 7403]|uniref:type II toxin-antitoxin system RelE/ParE family toxin n=1 Tax=Tumidithrix helvetica TaxID=3457545 RepID=UPI003CA9BAFD
MSLPIVFRVEAQAEFDEAFDWYEQQRTGLGVDFLMCVAEILEHIESLPEAYEIIYEDVRRAVVRKFPYLILYKVEPDRVVVLAVFHSKRDPQVWQDRV